MNDHDTLYPDRNMFWGMYCVETTGGCGAEVHGDSAEEAILKWNRRSDPRVQSGVVPLPVNADHAAAMANVGLDWLKTYAPDRLTEAFRWLDKGPGSRRLPWVLNGDQDSRYNNWLAVTPFGRVLITWKGWKEDPDACIDEFPGGFDAYGSPDRVRDDAEAEFWRRVDALTFKEEK